MEIFITNLGKYSEGDLVGEYLELPATTEELQALFKRIGVDGKRYEEVFITDYKAEFNTRNICISEYASIDELNYLAAMLSDLTVSEMEQFEAAVEYGDRSNSIKDLINLTQNLDCYEFYSGIDSESDLGYFMIDELGCLEIPDEIQGYFDYEAYGRDALFNGGAITDYGYIENNGNSFDEVYDGDEIPDEYQIFAYPKPEKASITGTLRAFQNMIDALPPTLQDKSKPLRCEEL